jgi:hypothetical protein
MRITYNSLRTVRGTHTAHRSLRSAVSVSVRLLMCSVDDVYMTCSTTRMRCHCRLSSTRRLLVTASNNNLANTSIHYFALLVAYVAGYMFAWLRRGSMALVTLLLVLRSD